MSTGVTAWKQEDATALALAPCDRPGYASQRSNDSWSTICPRES
jgi:hypothetical protein